VQKNGPTRKVEPDKEALFQAQSLTTSNISQRKPQAGNKFILNDKEKLDEKHVIGCRQNNLIGHYKSENPNSVAESRQLLHGTNPGSDLR